jgi:hypothetical protein
MTCSPVTECGYDRHDHLSVHAITGDDLSDPPGPATVVHLHGNLLQVFTAIFALQRADLSILDVLAPHPCSPSHGCLHAAVLLDGYVSDATGTAVMTQAFDAPHANQRHPFMPLPPTSLLGIRL